MHNTLIAEKMPAHYFFATSRAIILNSGKILIAKGAESSNGFYILPGGKIEFWERSKDALSREMAEEMKTKLKAIKYLGVLENFFGFDEKMYHEYVFIYSARFVNRSLYRERVINVKESSGRRVKFEWISLRDVRSEKYKILPPGVLKLLIP